MLNINEKVLMTGESVVEGQVAATYNAQIDSADPGNIIFTSRQNDKELYKKNRKVCIADQAEFEDAAYARQDEMIAKSNVTE